MELSTSTNFHHVFLLIFLLCHGLMLPPVFASNLDHKLLVYKHCKNQTSADHLSSSRSSIISALFQELLDRSSQSRFFETNAGDDKIAIQGLFQCRGDLSNDDCYNCVNKLPEVSNSLCGGSIPARVHLSGCYIHYQADGVQLQASQSRLQLLHKICSAHTGSSRFREHRDAAFAAVEECVLSGQGFCDLRYESVHVITQCDGNLGACDCSGCVNYAVQRAQQECYNSVSGEIYLDSCFISYSNYKDGTYGDSDDDDESSGTSSNKIIAIVIGGIAAASVLIGLWYFCQSCRKKKDDF